MRSEDKPYGRAFAQRIQIIRNANGLTQLELASRLRKPQSFVCKVESCKLMVTIDLVIAFADALGMDPRELFADALEVGKGFELVQEKSKRAEAQLQTKMRSRGD